MLQVEVSDLERWLAQAVSDGASDLHLVADNPPTLRLHGKLVSLAQEALEKNSLSRVLRQLGGTNVNSTAVPERNLDFALSRELDGKLQRFRANYFLCGDELGACFRVIPDTIPDFSWAGFPEELAHRLAHLRNGLVLVAGMTGAGKTTTLAMIVNLLNREGGYRIITAEDPVEYIFPQSENSIVTQREVGRDIVSFADGLKYGLRQDPDVILVGEIRDLETAKIALSAAETGHLVFSTIHTRDAKGAISRFTDLFSMSSQPEVRAQLAMGLRAVVSQQLLPSAIDDKRVLALEILFNNNPIAAGIRTGKLETIDTGITTGRADGMQLLDESIRQLVYDGVISAETAKHYVSNPAVLNR